MTIDDSAPWTPGRLATASILVVGDAMLDQYWFGDVDRISPEAPVPIVRVTGEEFRLGGAANVALNISMLGAKATLLSVVGCDNASERMLDLLSRHAVTALLRTDSTVTTTVKLRVSGRAQQLLRIDFEDRPQEEALAGVSNTFAEQIALHDAVLLSDYGKGGLAHVARMIALARERGKPVLVDPKGDDYRLYSGATLLTPNRAELARVVGQWTDDTDFEMRAQKLRRELDLAALLVTRSEEGMSLFDDQGHLHVPTQAREVFDVTGAGDTVIATLAAMLASGATLRDAVPVANRAGGIVVGKFGTSTLTHSELFA